MPTLIKYALLFAADALLLRYERAFGANRREGRRRRIRILAGAEAHVL